MMISLPGGWGQRVDAQKFAHLLEQIWSSRQALGLPEDPGEGPDSFNIPHTDQSLFFLEQLYGQSAQVVLRRIAAASLIGPPTCPGEDIFARMGQALHGTLGIIAAMAIPIIGVMLIVWMLSFFGRSKEGTAGGFVAR